MLNSDDSLDLQAQNVVSSSVHCIVNNDSFSKAREQWPRAVTFSEREEIFPSVNLESLF